MTTNDEAPRSALLVTAGAVLISLAAIFVRLADVEPTVSAFYRMLFGSITLFALLAIRPTLARGLSVGWAASLLIAAFFAADLWFWHRSIVSIGPGLATLLANFQVFVLAAVGVLVYREQLGPRVALAIALAALGLWLLFGQEWSTLAPGYRVGIGFGLATALAYSAYLLSLRHAQGGLGRISGEARLAQVSVLCCLMLAAINLGEGQGFSIPDIGSLIALIALGVCCQVLGWLAITRGMPGLPASLIGLLLLLQPTLSMLWDVLLFDLSLSSWQWAGAALALLGIYLGMRASRR